MSELVLEVRNLSRSFGKTAALSGVNLSLPRGVVFGLVGENGAGKTTLIKHVLGLLRAQTGSVRVFGLDPVAEPASVLGRIGYLSEDRELPEWMRVDELKRYTQAFYPDWDERLADELQQTFELDGGQKIHRLSRGQRARAGLLVALAHRPRLLVLDEPSSGLDPIVRRDILTAIIRTVADEGRNVLFSSHLLEEVERVADHVAMIHRGRIVLSGPLDGILAAHQQLTLVFAEPLREAPRLPGGLSCVGEGRQWTCLCDGEIELAIRAALEAGAEVVERRGASLEEIFVARSTGSRLPCAE